MNSQITVAAGATLLFLSASFEEQPKDGADYFYAGSSDVEAAEVLAQSLRRLVVFENVQSPEDSSVPSWVMADHPNYGKLVFKPNMFDDLLDAITIASIYSYKIDSPQCEMLKVINEANADSSLIKWTVNSGSGAWIAETKMIFRNHISSKDIKAFIDLHGFIVGKQIEDNIDVWQEFVN